MICDEDLALMILKKRQKRKYGSGIRSACKPDAKGSDGLCVVIYKESNSHVVAISRVV